MLEALPPVFAGLELADSQEAAAYLQPLELEAGEILMEQGEEDFTLAFVVRGSVSLLDGDVRIGGIGGHQMLGEIELFGQMPRVATAECSGPVKLQVLAHDAWVALCEAGNPAVFNLERHAHRKLSERLRWLNQGIVERSRGQSLQLQPRNGLFARLSRGLKARSAPPTDPSEVLASSGLFSWAEPAVIDEIARAFDVERFGPDEVVCREGEAGDRMYVIAEGQVDVVLLTGEDRAETVSQLGAGDAFGDASLAQNTPRAATCVTRGEVLALSMNRTQYGQLFAVDDVPGTVFRQSMLRNLIRQVLDAQKRYVAFERRQAAEAEETIRGTPVSSVWRD